jgi:hypothetical protein
MRQFGRSEESGLGLDPLEAEFVRIARTTFDFLIAEWAFRFEVSGYGTDEIVVLFKNVRIGIQVTLSGWENLMLFALPLTNGRGPEYFDSQLNDLYTGFSLDEYFGHVDPSWQRPQRAHLATPEQIEAALRPYGQELSLHGQRLLRGDPALLGEMRDLARQKTIEVYLRNWARFVQRIRAGFDGPITEYAEGITARAQLNAVLTVWKGNPEHDPVDEVARLDRAFDEVTEPLKWGAGKNLILPTPAGRRWWRRPRWLTGQLRDYFTQYG